MRFSTKSIKVADDEIKKRVGLTDSFYSVMKENQKVALEILYSTFLPLKIGNLDRLVRFSGDTYIRLCCGIRPVFIYHADSSSTKTSVILINPPIEVEASSWKRRYAEVLHLCDIEAYMDNPIYQYSGSRDSRGLYHGAGTVKYRNGSTFQGIFSEGETNGYGKYVFKAGGMIEGHFSPGWMLSGDGVWRYLNGMTYSGIFVDSLKEKQGRLVYENGDVYIGQFHDDMRSGIGKLTQSNGSEYEGAWLEDSQHGLGKMVWASGQVYIGQFFDGRPHGSGGVLTYPNGDIYKGQWVHGMRHGTGTFTCTTGSWTAEYCGQWLSDTMDGNGKITFSNGDSYEGSFSRNLFHGQGVYKSAVGDVYIGQFQLGLQSGDGVMTYWNGCVYGSLFLHLVVFNNRYSRNHCFLFHCRGGMA